MTLTTCTALITLGMFLWPVVRWAGQHWKWVMLSLIPLVGAFDGAFELAVGHRSLFIILGLAVNAAGFALFRLVPAAGAAGVEMVAGFTARVLNPTGQLIRRFVGYDSTSL
jgi:hypothetical protein